PKWRLPSPSTLGTASAEASSATTPTLPLAPMIGSMLCGLTPTTCKASPGTSAASSTLRLSGATKTLSRKATSSKPISVEDGLMDPGAARKSGPFPLLQEPAEVTRLTGQVGILTRSLPPEIMAVSTHIPEGLDRKEAEVFAKLDASSLPRHIAIIMDGNGRWARRRHLPRIAGHRAGVKAVRNTVETAARIGVPALTLYAFSAENWKRRPKTEVDFLMNLLRKYLKDEVPTLNKNNIRL